MGPILSPAPFLDRGKAPRIQETHLYVKRWDSQEGFLLLPEVRSFCLAVWIPGNNLLEIFS